MVPAARRPWVGRRPGHPASGGRRVGEARPRSSCACRSRTCRRFKVTTPAWTAPWRPNLEANLEAPVKLRDKNREDGTLDSGDRTGERGATWGKLECADARGLFHLDLGTGDGRGFTCGFEAASHPIGLEVVRAANRLVQDPWGPAPVVGEVCLHYAGQAGGYCGKAPLAAENT